MATDPVISDSRRTEACLEIHRVHGRDARLWVAGRVGALAFDGNAAGVERFRLTT